MALSASTPAARQKRSKLADTSSKALPTGPLGMAVVVVLNLFMALLSFRGISTPSLRLKASNAAPSISTSAGTFPHYAREVVREHVQRHLGRHLWQRLHQKVRRPHPHLQRAEWVLDRLAACSHRIRIFVEPRLHVFDNVLVLPPRDAALRSLRALSLQRAGMARVGPVAAQDQSIFLVREVVGELLTSRTDVNVLLSHVAEVLLAEAPFRLCARRLRFWQRDCDAGLFACVNLLTFEVAAIGDGFEAFCPQCRLR